MMQAEKSFSFEIVTLAPDEWPAYRRLRLEALQDSPQAFGTTYKDQVDLTADFWRKRLEQAARAEDQWLHFARSGGNLVGLTGAFLEAQSEDSSSPPTAVIISVYVTPVARGRGVARALMQSILDELKARGVKRARLGVMVDQRAARKLYESFGFVTVDIVYRLMGDGLYHDDLLMKKEI